MFKTFSLPFFLMLLLEKQGIVFALVEKRFSSFEQMTLQVQRVFNRIKARPVVIVFPELALGEKPVSRPESKVWIRQVQQLAKEHGNGHIFLSVLEKAPLKKSITNTGYLIGPKALNENPGKPMNWKAYAKASLPLLDFRQLERSENADAAFQWRERARRISNSLLKGQKPKRRKRDVRDINFPSVVINGKRVELRVCADIDLKNKTPANVVVVPAFGLNRQAIKLGQLYRSLHKNGFAIINDTESFWERNACLLEPDGIVPLLHQAKIRQQKGYDRLARKKPV